MIIIEGIRIVESKLKYLFKFFLFHFEHFSNLSTSEYKRLVKNYFKKKLMKLGLAITTKRHYQQLENSYYQNEILIARNGIFKNDYKLLKYYVSLNILNKDTILKAFEVLSVSKSQLRQDIFCLIVNNWKEEGYFVDFGATNGIDINNTYILESQFNWTGILAEPSPRYHDELQLNRHTNIELNCVWEKSGELLDFIQAGELGQILDFKGIDNHKRHGNLIKVITISLNDLLRKYEAPPIIDYLSIDTEGSEYNILRSLNFDQYRFNCISVEHNLTKNRELIFKLLTSHGYKRVLTEISLFDDWYVHHTSPLVLPS